MLRSTELNTFSMTYIIYPVGVHHIGWISADGWYNTPHFQGYAYTAVMKRQVLPLFLNKFVTKLQINNRFVTPENSSLMILNQVLYT